MAFLCEGPAAYLSVLTIGELERGARLLQLRDAARAEPLTEWISRLAQEHRERTLNIDRDVIERWAELPAGRTLPMIDSLLAATALRHELVVATRNIRGFAATGARTFDPFLTRLGSAGGSSP